MTYFRVRGFYSIYLGALVGLRPRGSLLVQTIYIVSGKVLMLVTLSTCSTFVARHECYIHSRSQWWELLAISTRLTNSSGRVTVWPGYADFYFTEMQTFAYSPAPVSGGSLRSLIYPGDRRLHRPLPVWIFPFPTPPFPGCAEMRVLHGVRKHVFWRYPPKTPIFGVPANPPFGGHTGYLNNR
jgi:hypothetical protein